MIRFTLDGKPTPKARPRARVIRNGRNTFAQIYTPKSTLAFEEDIGKAANVIGIRPHEGIVAVTLRFYGCSQGDIDNLAKSVLDGLNGIAWADDRQVEELHVFVDRRGQPARTEVEIDTKGAL